MIQQREKVRALEEYFNLRKNPSEIQKNIISSKNIFLLLFL